MQIEFVQHTTASDVFLSFLKTNYTKADKKKLLEKIVPPRFSTKKTPLKVKKIIKQIYKYGIWGYCSHSENKKEIHYWIGKQSNEHKIRIFLAHELSHIYGYEKESEAIKIANICSLTNYCMTTHKFKKLIKGKYER